MTAPAEPGMRHGDHLSELPFDPERLVGSLRALVDAAVADGYAGLHVTGDMSWATRDAPGADRLLEYENRVGKVFAGRPAASLCHYDLRRFDRPTVEVASALHNLSHLRFIDLGGAEELAHLALEAPGRRVVLRRASPALRRLLDLFWPGAFAVHR